MAEHTLKGAFRHIDSTKARVILLDAAPAVLPPMGAKLGQRAAARLQKLGVEIQLGAMVTLPSNHGLSSTGPAGSKCCPTCPFPGTRTCSWWAIWPLWRVCRVWRRAPSRGRNTSARRSVRPFQHRWGQPRQR
ncbi:hypothetical protein ACNJMN_07845 [Mycobacterium tuberculosis]